MFGKKRREKKDFNLTYDNLAIPEVHTGQDETADSSITPDSASDDAAVTDDVLWTVMNPKSMKSVMKELPFPKST